jgi:hypothetical protein
MKPAERQRPPARGADASINNPKTLKVTRHTDRTRRPLLIGSDVDTTRGRLHLIFDIRGARVTASVRHLLCDSGPLIETSGAPSPDADEIVRGEVWRLLDYWQAQRRYDEWIAGLEKVRQDSSEYDTGWARRWSA